MYAPSAVYKVEEHGAATHRAHAVDGGGALLHEPAAADRLIPAERRVPGAAAPGAVQGDDGEAGQVHRPTRAVAARQRRGRGCVASLAVKKMVIIAMQHRRLTNCMDRRAQGQVHAGAAHDDAGAGTGPVAYAALKHDNGRDGFRRFGCDGAIVSNRCV